MSVPYPDDKPRGTRDQPLAKRHGPVMVPWGTNRIRGQDMRFVRYGEVGREQPAVLDAEDQLRDLSGVVPDLAGRVLEDLPRINPHSLPRVPGNPRIGPPVGRVGKLVCTGLNYSDHAAELGVTPPDDPVVFLKATSAINGPFDPVILPRGAAKCDWEVELGI